MRSRAPARRRAVSSPEAMPSLLSALGGGQRRWNGRPSGMVPRSGVLRRPDFVRGVVAISTLASLLSPTALPLAAILVLSARGLSCGLSAAWERVTAFRAQLAGRVSVARLPRRPVLIVMELGRAVPGATVPVASPEGRSRSRIATSWRWRRRLPSAWRASPSRVERRCCSGRPQGGLRRPPVRPAVAEVVASCATASGGTAHGHWF